MIFELLKQKDIIKFQQGVTEFFQKTPEKQGIWADFCVDLNNVTDYHEVKLDRTEMWWLCRAGYLCLVNSKQNSDYLPQFKRLAIYLKYQYGAASLRMVFGYELNLEEYQFDKLLKACHFLMELFQNSNILTKFNDLMPDLSNAVKFLEKAHEVHLTSQFPKRELDDVLTRFQDDPMVKFPISREVLQVLKKDYLAIQEQINALQKLSLEQLKTNIKTLPADVEFTAYMVELIRRFYQIYPRDVQLLAFLALSRTPEDIKGYIGQIKTGEGKSLIIAMLAGFIAHQGDFVDIVTSSDYLAIRDAEKYQPFFDALGLTVSNICHREPTPAHFSGQILYGTDKDFEFALLRDGLYRTSLRQSYRNGTLVPRTLDKCICITDEIDSLLLDKALHSALLSIPREEDLSCIYEPIYRFVEQFDFQHKTLQEAVQDLNEYLGEYVKRFKLDSIRLTQYLKSAKKAMNTCHEKQDYVIKPIRRVTVQGYEEINSIVIMDPKNTGRDCEGSEWQHGLHQFLQVKHGLTITPEALTAASLGHPTYFRGYRRIVGLTGTIGEPVEREEIKKIYDVETFDVPPFVPSLRQRLPSQLCTSEMTHFKTLLESYKTMQAKNRPVLILFETIETTENFFNFVKQKGFSAQLLNTLQRESEDYIVAKAGDAGKLTIATNLAGRGTDIILSPDSIAAGGLHVIYGFYPNNVRVEEQGFGRGARQGQPGSGQMILSLQDARIQKLLCTSSSNLNEIVSQEIIHSQLSSNQCIEADDFVEYLNNLRSDSIERYSQERIRGAEREAVFFEKLKQFFEGLDQVYAYFESPLSKEDLIIYCNNFSLQQSPIELTNNLFDKPNLEKLIILAQNLIEQQLKGLTVNWAAFLDQFKTFSLSAIKKQWSQFYNQLHDQIGYGEIAYVKQTVDQAYKAAKGKFELFLEQPKEAFFNLLAGILSITVSITKDKQQGINNSFSAYLNKLYENNNERDKSKTYTSLLSSASSRYTFFEENKEIPLNQPATSISPMPENAMILYNKAVDLYKKKCFEQAINLLNSAIHKFHDTNNSSAKMATCYSTLASAQRELELFEEALASCDKALCHSKEHQQKAIEVKRETILTKQKNTIAKLNDKNRNLI